MSGSSLKRATITAAVSAVVIAASGYAAALYNAQLSAIHDALARSDSISIGQRLGQPRSGELIPRSETHPLAGTKAIVYDATPPSVPTGVTLAAQSCSTVLISWNPSTDTGGSGLAGYRVYRNGVRTSTVLAPTTSTTEAGLSGNTTYSYAVSAYDGYGNESATSSPRSITTPACVSWRYDFGGTSLDTAQWQVSNKQAPGYIQNTHRGYFVPANVAVADGFLRIELNQSTGTVDTNPNGITSRGGEILSKNVYGYGTYEWQMKMGGTGATPSSTGSSVPGGVSAGFNYVNNSQTEIDFEMEGDAGTKLYMTTWLNPNPLEDPIAANHTVTSTEVSGMSSSFKNYKFIWSPGSVDFYVDNVLKATNTTNVPAAPAYFMVNHWGTDWGGISTIGTPRYLFVDWVRYTAPGETPVP